MPSQFGCEADLQKKEVIVSLGHCTPIIIRWGILLGSDSRNALSFRLILLFLLLCLFAELLELRLLKRLQLVVVLGRILPRVNRNSTRKPVIITCLALLLLGSSEGRFLTMSKNGTSFVVRDIYICIHINCVFHN
jgi:hypothetical protein